MLDLLYDNVSSAKITVSEDSRAQLLRSPLSRVEHCKHLTIVVESAGDGGAQLAQLALSGTTDEWREQVISLHIEPHRDGSAAVNVPAMVTVLLARLPHLEELSIVCEDCGGADTATRGASMYRAMATSARNLRSLVLPSVGLLAGIGTLTINCPHVCEVTAGVCRKRRPRANEHMLSEEVVEGLSRLLHLARLDLRFTVVVDDAVGLLDDGTSWDLMKSLLANPYRPPDVTALTLGVCRPPLLSEELDELRVVLSRRPQHPATVSQVRIFKSDQGQQAAGPAGPNGSGGRAGAGAGAGAGVSPPVLEPVAATLRATLRALRQRELPELHLPQLAEAARSLAPESSLAQLMEMSRHTIVPELDLQPLQRGPHDEVVLRHGLHRFGRLAECTSLLPGQVAALPCLANAATSAADVLRAAWELLWDTARRAANMNGGNGGGGDARLVLISGNMSGVRSDDPTASVLDALMDGILIQQGLCSDAEVEEATLLIDIMQTGDKPGGNKSVGWGKSAVSEGRQVVLEDRSGILMHVDNPQLAKRLVQHICMSASTARQARGTYAPVFEAALLPTSIAAAATTVADAAAPDTAPSKTFEAAVLQVLAKMWVAAVAPGGAAACEHRMAARLIKLDARAREGWRARRCDDPPEVSTRGQESDGSPEEQGGDDE